MLSDWLVFILLGRLIIYLWQNFPLPEFLSERKTIDYLHGCDLCSGVWVYSILAGFMQMDLLELFGFWYVPLLSELVVGAIVSFLTHIFIIGWKAKFDVVVV